MKTYHIQRSGLCLFILLILAVHACRAEPIKLCGVEWPPFTYQRNDLIYKGVSYDIFTEAFKRLNVEFLADALTWPRCLEYVKKGIYDAVIDNADTASFINGQHPTSIYPLGVYVRKHFDKTAFSWEDMRGKVVGLVRGYDYTPKIVGFDGWQKDLAVTDEMLMRKLKAKHHDYIIMDIFAAPLHSEKVGVEIKMLKPLVDSTNLYLVFNKDKKSLLERYDKVIGDMIVDGTIDRIYKEHLPYSYHEILQMGK